MERTTIVLEQFHGVALTHVAGIVSPDFWSDTPHSHDHCEIFIHLAGQMEVFVEQNRYRLAGGEIRVYRSGELHCGKSDFEAEMEWFQISLPHAFFLQEENSSLAPVLFAREAGEGNVFFSLAAEEMATLLAEVFSAHAAGNPRLPHYAESAVQRILCLLNEPRHNRPVSARQDRALGRILDVVNASFRQISTVAELSDATHYSVSYLNRIFKEQMDITPYRFLTAKKLNEAKKALLGGCTVTEACEYAGFNNYSNFITLFRKTFHQTPKQYRARSAVNTGKEPL